MRPTKYMEQNAKHLAGALLMPASKFRPLFDKHNQSARATIPVDLSRLRHVFFRLNWAFDASAHALAIRALKLGLISQSELDSFLSYITRENA